MHAVLSARHDRVGSEFVTDQQEVPIVARASTKDRLLVATRAEREIELGSEAFFGCESVKGDLPATLERCELFGCGGGQRCAELSEGL